MPNILEKDEIIHINFRNDRFNYEGSVDIHFLNYDHQDLTFCKYKNIKIELIDNRRIFGPKMDFLTENESAGLFLLGHQIVHLDPVVASVLSDRAGRGTKLHPYGVCEGRGYFRYEMHAGDDSYDWDEGFVGDWKFAGVRSRMQIEASYLYGQHNPLRY